MSETITIVHTLEHGTVAFPSGRGATADQHMPGFRRSRDLPEDPELGEARWYVPHTRARRAKTLVIDTARQALEAAGFTVDVRIDNVTPPVTSFADREAERTGRALDRVDRYDGYASAATGRGEAILGSAAAVRDQIPLGQPILPGHHSERGHRRLLARLDARDDRGMDELRRGKYWANRAASARSPLAKREDLAVTLRRIDRLEVRERQLLRDLDGSVHQWERVVVEDWSQGFGRSLEERLAERPGAVIIAEHEHHVDVRIPVSDADRQELETELEVLREQLEHWRALVAEAETAGAKVWGAGDFTKGDFVDYGLGWSEVVRVNKKTLSVPAGALDGVEPFTMAQMRENYPTGGWTDTVSYDRVRGRMSAQDARARWPHRWAPRLDDPPASPGRR